MPAWVANVGWLGWASFAIFLGWLGFVAKVYCLLMTEHTA